MGLLAPLYVAGALAVTLPIVFHLIRRTPTGRQAFGSLMFLSPSPPRLARRSRLSNILLLLLRAAALLLLAAAFARPFFSAADAAAADAPRGRRVAVLVDTSASMRRGDLWPQAVRQAEQALADLKPGDEAALFFFDRQVRPGLTFAEWADLPGGQRAAVFRGRLAAAGPTWAGTRLGDALAAVADQLAAEDGAPPAAGRAGRQLVLISDLQQGGHADALQGHAWPEGVLLQVRAVAPPPTVGSNAAVQLAGDPTAALPAAGQATGRGTDGADADDRLRVRVANQPGAAREQFTLAWANDAGPVPGAAPVKAYVPAGRSQIVRVPWPRPADPGPASSAATRPSTGPVPATKASAAATPTSPGAAAPPGPVLTRPADRLVLAGDDADFDNTVYVVPPAPDVVRVLYLGPDAADDVNGLRYYLQGALAGGPDRRVEFLARPAAGPPAAPVTPADLADLRLAVATAALPDSAVDRLRRYADAGGTILWVLRDAAAAGGLGRLTGLPDLSVAEAPEADFALVGRVDLSHPLFAAFADPRFADFTKVHFWKHRHLTASVAGLITRPTGGPSTTPAIASPVRGPADPAGVRVLARFDDGSPFLVERPLGRGRVVVATAGWHPADSQLALSTKFVPLVDGLIRRPDGATIGAQHTVYEPVPLPPADPDGPGTPTGSARALVTPDGRRIDLPAGLAAAPATAVDRPGVYQLIAGGRKTAVAVNLSPDESRTAPLAVEDLERYGAKLGTAETADQFAARQRQLRQAELEGRQKLWRWVILGVLGLLAAETLVAGRLARRPEAAVAA